MRGHLNPTVNNNNKTEKGLLSSDMLVIFLKFFFSIDTDFETKNTEDMLTPLLACLICLGGVPTSGWDSPDKSDMFLLIFREGGFRGAHAKGYVSFRITLFCIVYICRCIYI